MAILYNEETRQFHLCNGAFSYIIEVLGNGYIGHVYCGAPLGTERPYPFLSPMPFNGHSNSSNLMRFEYPAYGNGDYKLPAFSVVFSDGSGVVEPVYKSYRIAKGKPAIAAMPATYVEKDDEAETLELYLEDAISSLKITLYYTIFASYNCIARHTCIKNSGNKKVTLRNAMSLNLDLPDADWNLITFTGAWTREFQATDQRLRTGVQGVESTRGISGHQQNPFLILKRFNTDNFTGEALGFSLIYSGNFHAGVEVDSSSLARVRLGLNPETFSWNLDPGAAFDTPEAVIAYSGNGMNHLSHQFHGLYRTRLATGTWRDKERPILFNNWEGTYFNFTEKKLLEMAQIAHDLGIELFVLDDGWFGKRDNDHTSLGDWFPDTQKLPEGITGLAKKITALGIKFGLWIEPEMISQKSNLFEAHPDWAIGVPGRFRTEQRWQYVLDMSRSEIVDYLVETLSKVFSTSPISYIKWDMNRSLTEPYSLSLPPERQGEFFHRYCLGVYALYERLTKAFPDILFESCCSGGGRFDAGILGYAPQGWLSDDTDALQRLSIQEGASFCYPLSAIGAHVSAVPNHQTGRFTSLSFRAMTAFFGTLGFELDPTKLTDGEKAEIVKYVSFYKKHRVLFQQGRFSRLLSSALRTYSAWQVVSEDGKEAIIGFYRLLAQPSSPPQRLFLKDLAPNAVYEVSVWEEGGYEENDRTFNCGQRGGDELMRGGLLLDAISTGNRSGDFHAELFHLCDVCQVVVDKRGNRDVH
ncbi:MAG: alpha-galactosidase [Treponema sp.]|jgi:alpha-galactosidase|nr:alpha-galactosidase [Treponema sp.]